MSLKDYLAAHPGSPHFKKKFVSMWVAGTMGAYLTFLFRNLSLDLPTFSFHQIHWTYTFGVLIRYAYLLWFLAYFFASNVGHERNNGIISKWAIGFDVTQATLGFFAAFFLGFIGRDEGNVFSYSPSAAVRVANGVIAAICISSLICFGYHGDTSKENRELNCLRWLGFSSSLLALGAVIVASRVGCACKVLAMSVPALFGLGPFLALKWFIQIEWERKSPDSLPSSVGCTGAR
jgi:hypothetical protein